MDPKLLYQIKLAKELDRYEDMRIYVFEYLNKLPDSFELDYNTRKLISQAYLNCINKKINTFRLLEAHGILNKHYNESTVKSVMSENLTEPNDYKPYLSNYREKKEEEFKDYINKIISNEIDKYIAKFNKNPEDKLYFAKMKADFEKFMYDYVKIANFTDINHVKESYNSAMKLAYENKIRKDNIIYLNLRLNYYCLCFLDLEEKRGNITKLNNENTESCNKEKEKFEKEYGNLLNEVEKAKQDTEKILNPKDYEKSNISEDLLNDYRMTYNLFEENLASWSLHFERNKEDETDEPSETADI